MVGEVVPPRISIVRTLAFPRLSLGLFLFVPTFLSSIYFSLLFLYYYCVCFFLLFLPFCFYCSTGSLLSSVSQCYSYESTLRTMAYNGLLHSFVCVRVIVPFTSSSLSMLSCIFSPPPFYLFLHP